MLITKSTNLIRYLRFYICKIFYCIVQQSPSMKFSVILGQHRQCRFANGKTVMVPWIGLQALEWAPTGWVDQQPMPQVALWREGKKLEIFEEYIQRKLHFLQ